MMKFKLYLYKFLGKFSNYFKRKYIDMAIERVTTFIENELNNKGYVTSIVVNINDYNNLRYDIIFTIKLKTEPYLLMVRLSCVNKNIIYHYSLYVSVINISASKEIEEITYNDLLNEQFELTSFFVHQKNNFLYQFQIAEIND